MKPKPRLRDSDIRPVLRSRLSATHAGDPETVFIEELGLCRGKVRIDLAAVNGILHGYEIKSDRDSLRRLVGQVEVYSKVLDRATLVVGRRHLHQTLNLVPSWWEILRIDSNIPDPRIRSVRRGRKNPNRDPRSLVELLWLDESISLLERIGAANGVKGKPRRFVWDRICELFDIDQIAEAVRACLKGRVKPTNLQLPL